MNIEETRISDVDAAHGFALKEQERRSSRPSRDGFLTSNHQYAHLSHRVEVRENRGAAGTLFGYYRAPRCGAKIGGAYGASFSPDIPQSFDLCPKCKNKK